MAANQRNDETHDAVCARYLCGDPLLALVESVVNDRIGVVKAKAHTEVAILGGYHGETVVGNIDLDIRARVKPACPACEEYEGKQHGSRSVPPCGHWGDGRAFRLLDDLNAQLEKAKDACNEEWVAYSKARSVADDRVVSGHPAEFRTTEHWEEHWEDPHRGWVQMWMGSVNKCRWVSEKGAALIESARNDVSSVVHEAAQDHRDKVELLTAELRASAEFRAAESRTQENRMGGSIRIVVEVKTGVVPLGKTMRQINKYKIHRKHTDHWVILSTKPIPHRAAFEHEGVRVIYTADLESHGRRQMALVGGGQ